MDTLVEVVVVAEVHVEEAIAKEGVEAVVKEVAAHQGAHLRHQVVVQEALHQFLQEGKEVIRVAQLAVVDKPVQEGQEEGQAGEVLQVEDEEAALVGDLAEGKAIVEAPPLQVNQAMDQPAVVEETLETTTTTTALLLARLSLVMEPLVVMEVFPR